MIRKQNLKIITILFACLAILTIHRVAVQAQSEDSVWTLPVNLSNSGSTSTPVSVMDETGSLHVIWKDALAGYIYAKHDGTEWSEPEPLEFPFDPELTVVLRLVSDDTGRIHAFWVSENEDDKDLYHSFVPSDSFAIREQWSFRNLIATDITTVEATPDSHNGLHVIYVKALDSENEPAGVYYRKSTNRGNNWLAAQQFYTSPYYRDLPEEEIHLSIISGPAGDTDWVQGAWDNQPRELVLSTRSADNGTTWETATIVDGPIDIPDTHTNFQIELAANDQNVLRLWESGIPGELCSHTYQSSPDGGATWTPPEQFLEDFTGCLGGINFVPLGPELMIMTFRHRTLPYLIAWNNSEWGEPLLQTDLTELNDPETLNQVILNCLQAGFASSTLEFVGCDDNGADIWTSSRTLSEGDQWYPIPPAWSVPLNLTSTSSDLLSPSIVIDPENRVHVIWVEVVEQEGVPDTAKIFYTRRESNSWSTPRTILTSPEGDAVNPSMTLDNENRLHVVWSQGETGKLFYSWANTGSAVSLTEWSEQTELPVPREAASSPRIVSDGRGTLYVIYTVPLNEQRGVYLVRSEDNGSSWSEPFLVFDAELAGWDMVDDPHLSVSGNNVLNALWTHSTLPAGAGWIGLYSSRSEDRGETWKPGEEVVAESILWSELVNSNQLAVHRVWQAPIIDHTVFRHQESADTGQIWTSPIDLTGLAQQGPADLAVDGNGQLHLLQINEASLGNPVLDHWVWDGNQWTLDGATDMRDGSIQNISLVSTSVGPSGLLGSVFIGERIITQSTSTTDNADNAETSESSESPGSGERVDVVLLYTDRQLDLGDQTPIVVPTLTITPPPTEAAEATPEVQPTATIDLSEFNTSPPQQPGFLNQLDGWAGAGIGIVSAGLIIIAVFIFGVRRQRL